MLFTRPPDWLLYGVATATLAVIALAARERADAPPAPPPMPGAGAALTAGPSLVSAAVRLLPATDREGAAGTAFSVSETGVWITARRVVEGCRRAAVLVGTHRGVLAKVFTDPSSDLAVLTTEGGAAPLRLATDAPLDEGQPAFQPGYPRGGPGEAAARFQGRDVLRAWTRDAPRHGVLVWAETGRTEGMSGGLDGLAGAPVLDGTGQVVGVTLAEAPRRGRIYSTSAKAIRAILAEAGQTPSALGQGMTLSTDTYGRAADDLRRNLRVAQAACID